MPSAAPLPQTARARCPRCRSRLRAERDRYGASLTCPFCGFTHDLVSPIVIDLSEDAEHAQPLRQSG